jgi:hypothetical protein
MSGKKYFYALGQRARSLGMSKTQAEDFFKVNVALPHASIYFDKGYRGLSL